MVLERWLSVGYRKSTEGGAWIVRRYDAARRRHIEDRIGTADDHRDADGTDVLNFAQAQRKVLDEATRDALRASGQLYTVADAVADYVEYVRTHRKSAPDTESKLKTYVVPPFSAKRVAELTAADFKTWLAWALRRRRVPKKARTESDASAQKDAPPSPTELAERQRRRKATLNRVINSLKACLNHAYAAGKVPSREAWARLSKFRSADSARLRWLTVSEARRLQNASSPEFRLLVRAALLTGCRAGELLTLRGSDFDPHSRTLLVADSKSGQPRRVPLTTAGVALFSDLAAGVAAAEPMFTRSDGSTWYRMSIVRAMRAACANAQISPTATFHTLRHTYASHLAQEGMPLLFIAAALGHSDARMVEKHYCHLAPSQVADMIREKLPTFGSHRRGKVRSLAR
jgi:integrase